MPKKPQTPQDFLSQETALVYPVNVPMQQLDSRVTKREQQILVKTREKDVEILAHEYLAKVAEEHMGELAVFIGQTFRDTAGELLSLKEQPPVAKDHNEVTAVFIDKMLLPTCSKGMLALYDGAQRNMISAAHSSLEPPEEPKRRRKWLARLLLGDIES